MTGSVKTGERFGPWGWPRAVVGGGGSVGERGKKELKAYGSRR